MTQRIITGALLVALLIFLMYLGGLVFSVGVLVCICIAMFEEYRALSRAGHRPVSLPSWIAIVASLLLAYYQGVMTIVAVLTAACSITLVLVIFREQPKLEDALMSILPLFTIALPGMFIVALANIPAQATRTVLLCYLFAVPVVGDTFAFFVGSRVGGPKLCPLVSPHKTQAGAIGGMTGSVLAAMTVYLVARMVVPGDQLSLVPSWWATLLLGLLGGVSAQLGDLFASMVKRHCGVKDFGNLFPGHGGMLDRIDSILFVSVVIFSYAVVALNA